MLSGFTLQCPSLWMIKLTGFSWPVTTENKSELKLKLARPGSHHYSVWCSNIAVGNMNLYILGHKILHTFGNINLRIQYAKLHLCRNNIIGKIQFLSLQSTKNHFIVIYNLFVQLPKENPLKRRVTVTNDKSLRKQVQNKCPRR